MSALGLGLLAALAWGVHDICVRYVSQRAGILPSLATVLATGALLVLPVAFWLGDWPEMTMQAYVFSGLSGVAFGIAGYGLYKAFEIGPVRLVAPVIGAYPVLSLAAAGLDGEPVTASQWAAGLAVIAGIALVAMLIDEGDSNGSRKAAVSWALLGAAGFALTFAAGQHATRAGAELPVLLVTRATAIAVILPLILLRTEALRGLSRQMPLLLLMGALDAVALGAIMVAAPLQNPEFAAVAASTFGIITIILARVFLGERMSPGQWGGVTVAFCGIGYLAI